MYDADNLYDKYKYKYIGGYFMYENIPSFIKELDIWLCYDDRAEDKKAPRDLQGKLLTKWTDKGYSYSECIESIRDGYNTGIGIVLKNNGIVAIDYDKCIKDIEINKKYGYKKIIFNDRGREGCILRDINLLQSYVEISPSKTGLHILLLADIKDLHIQKPIEIYTNKKYIRLTGDKIFDYDLNYANNEMLELLHNYKLDKVKKTGLRFNKSIYKKFLDKNFLYANSKTPKQIMDIMFASKKGEYIKSLFYDTLSDADYVKDKSKKIEQLYNKGIITADQKEQRYNMIDTSNSGRAYTLILYLIDYCYGNIDAVREIFKKSSLCKGEYLKTKYTENDYKINKIDYMIKKAIIGDERHRYKNYRL